MGVMKLITVFCFFLATVGFSASAKDFNKKNIDEISVKSAWARASVGRNGAAYITLDNKSKSSYSLIGCVTDIAERVELHTHLMDGTILRMRRVDSVEIPPGGTISMVPGGLHIMLIGLKEKLRKGRTFSLTLKFVNSDEIDISVQILGIGDMNQAHKKHGHQTEH